MAHFILETRTNGRLYFLGRALRAKYEAERELARQQARGKNVAVHTFATAVEAEAFVAAHNDKHPIFPERPSIEGEDGRFYPLEG